MAKTKKSNSKSQNKLGFILAAGILIPLVVMAWIINTREEVQPANADSTRPPKRSVRMIEVGGIQRPAPHPLSDAMFAESERYADQLVSRINEANKKGIVPEPPNKKLTKGMNANIDSVIEAHETGKFPERLSPLFKPKPFDAKAFKRDPQAYLDIVEPGRAWQSAPPGDDVKSIGTNRETHAVKAGESVRLYALAEASGPVTFTSTDLGAFSNDLASITVLANENGWAEANFNATVGTTGDVYISASSPLTSGRLRFRVRVEPVAQ